MNSFTEMFPLARMFPPALMHMGNSESKGKNYTIGHLIIVREYPKQIPVHH